MTRLIIFLVSGMLLLASVARAQGYQLSLKNEYLSKEDVNLIFKMSRTQWNEAVINLAKKNGI